MQGVQAVSNRNGSGRRAAELCSSPDVGVLRDGREYTGSREGLVNHWELYPVVITGYLPKQVLTRYLMQGRHEAGICLVCRGALAVVKSQLGRAWQL